MIKEQRQRKLGLKKKKDYIIVLAQLKILKKLKIYTIISYKKQKEIASKIFFNSKKIT